MLQSITITNFLSFKEAETFYFDNNQLKDDSYKGKSNFFKALSILQIVSRDSIIGLNRIIKSHFNNSEPSNIDVEFKLDDFLYKYSIVFNQDQIFKESFFKFNNDKFEPLIIREEENITFSVEKEYLMFLAHKSTSILTFNFNRGLKNPIKELSEASNYFRNFIFNSQEVINEEPTYKFQMHDLATKLNQNSKDTSELLKLLNIIDSDILDIVIINTIDDDYNETYSLFLKLSETYSLPYHLASSKIKYILELFYKFKFKTYNGQYKNFFADNFANNINEKTITFIHDEILKKQDFYYF